MNDTLRINLGKVTTMLSIIATASALVWTTAIAHDRLARAEARIQTLEEKMQWQNDVLWEIRGDLKVLRSEKH